jgi:adenylate cyclase
LERIDFERSLRLDVPAAELWPLVSNTNRFNRSLGLPAMTLEGVANADFEKSVTARLYGVPLAWKELPFEWVEPRFFESVRVFEKGPLERFEGGMQLVPQGEGCLVRAHFQFTARNKAAAFFVRHVLGRKSMIDAETMLRRFEAAHKGREADAFPARRTKTALERAVFRQKADRLKQLGGSAMGLDRLLAHLEGAYDDELLRMRPFELADRWGLARLDTLRAFFYGVKAGLLDMSWEILCPNCAAPKDVMPSLKDMRTEGHCPACDIVYGVNLDESVELRFSISPTIRPVSAHVFCVGNPSQSPFAVAQVRVDSQPRTLELTLAAESYAVRDLNGKSCVRLRPSEIAASEVTLDLSRPAGDECAFRPGVVKLTLKPPIQRSLVRVERESWKDRAAKASIVTSLQEFRDMFSSEVLAPGVEIGVRNVALLFSDLKDSTAMYERIGDASAYAVVRDHFEYLFEIIRNRRGAVVKTIGDAVMAVFSSAGDAVAAAIEMQERINELNRDLEPRPPVVIKLGVHQGPAIAINTDDSLDYFGTTVNVAARVQNESKGADIVISEPVKNDAGVAAAIAGHPCQIEDFQIPLKGLSEHFKLWRLKPAKKS